MGEFGRFLFLDNYDHKMLANETRLWSRNLKYTFAVGLHCKLHIKHIVLFRFSLHGCNVHICGEQSQRVKDLVLI